MAATRESKSNIVTTKNYRLFKLSEENRALNLKKHRKLRETMQLYGWLRCFPMVCTRNGSKELVVKDGQHRLAIAEELGLPVHYIVEEIDFDVALVNCTPKTWTLHDYAQKHATNGVKVYQEGLAFAELHALPIGTAFALLAGTTTFSNTQEAFYSGAFKIKDRDWADRVASTYSAMVAFSGNIRNARFMEAVMAVCRVDGFEASRLIRGAERCREKLVSYSTRDGYLQMIEELYNFGRKHLVGIRVAAVQAMKDRSAAKKS